MKSLLIALLLAGTVEANECPRGQRPAGDDCNCCESIGGGLEVCTLVACNDHGLGKWEPPVEERKGYDARLSNPAIWEWTKGKAVDEVTCGQDEPCNISKENK